jgi:hypothetical protein
MENKNKNAWMWGGVIILAIIIVWAVTARNNSSAPSITTGNEQTTTDSSEDTTEGSVNVGSAAATLSYKDALVKYAKARLQLDTTCQGSPSSMTFKNGSMLMVDNRSAISRTVKVGSTFTIKPWGFKIIKLSSSTLPATLLVDCGASQNVATILLQK